MRTSQTSEVLAALESEVELLPFILETGVILAPFLTFCSLRTGNFVPATTQFLALLLCFTRADKAFLIDTEAHEVECVIHRLAKLLILLYIDAADAKRAEEVVERLAISVTLEECTNAANGFDEVLLGSRVVDKRLERRVGVDITGSVQRPVEPLAEDVKDVVYRVVVLLVILRLVADLMRSSECEVPEDR